MLETVKEPIDFGGPGSSVGVTAHVLEIFQCLLVRLFDGERLAEVSDVVDTLELRDAGWQHHGEERDEEVGVLAQSQVSATAQFLEQEMLRKLHLNN